jgi:PAS domain S-box-containing protein
MMRAASLPVVAMSAVAFYEGAYHLLVWPRARHERIHLTFGLVCLLAMAYDLACAGLYSADSVIEGLRWQRTQRLVVAIEGVAFAWFVADYTRRAPRRLLYALSALAGLYALTVAVAPQWIFSARDDTLHVQLPLGLALTYCEVGLRPLGYSLEAFGVGLFAVAFVAARRQLRAGESASARRLLLALAVLCAGVANDALVAARVYAFVYTIEYAFMSIVVLMAFAFAERYRRAAAIEQSLRESEHRYRSLVEGTADMVLQIDREQRVVFANRGAAEAFGVPRQVLVGTYAVDLAYPEERERLRRTLAACFREPGPTTSFELRHLTLAEQTLVVLWTITPAVDENDKVVSLSAIGLDVTARNRADEEQFVRLQRIERQQEALFRLATNESVFSGDVLPAARCLTEAAAETLGVERVSVWRVSVDGRRIACVDRFERSRSRHSPGGSIALQGSVYYERIVSDRVVVANDAASDARLTELRAHEDALPAFGAVLDAPVRMAGWLAGTVRIEHVGGPRVWLDDEIVFASGLADQMTQVLLNADRRASEASLRVSEARYRSMLDAMDDMVYICSEQYRLEYLNPAMIRRVGRDATGELCYAALHDLAGVCPWCEALSSPGPAERKQEITSPKDERTYHVSPARIRNYDGSHSHMLILRDVTESRRNEAERLLLSAAIEQAAEIVLVTDSDGVIQYVNPAFERVTGYARAEAVGRTPSILKSGRQEPVFYEDLWNTVRAGRTWSGRFTNRKRDGTLYVEQAVISPVLDHAGRIVNFVGVKRDITAQVQLEERLKQAQKMEAIGQLAGGVAHDFNNLLTPIIGYTELLQMRFPAGDPTHGALSEIRRAGEGARRLTAQLLAFGRKQVIELRSLDLGALAGRLIRMLKRTIREDIEIVFRRAAAPTLVHADPSQLEQVLMNLVVNAQDAMPSGGRLLIDVDEATLTAPDGAGCLSPGRYALLSVSDTGVGIDAETLSHIFEPFFTTKARGKGTGLGLATAYGIIRQHGGEVVVESEPERGACFRVYLPLSQQPAEEERHDEPRETPRGRETILVVEDDDAVRRLTCSMLRAHGYTVCAAESGQSAIDLVEGHPAEISLLLTDVVMPGLSAPETYRRLLAIRPRLKVLYMSGYAEDVLGPQGVLAAGVELIDKPFTLEALTRKVREVLDAESD